MYSSPAVAPDGTVFLCSEDGHLYALTGQCGHECHHGRCDLHSGRCVCQAPYRGPNCAELCPGDVLNQSGKVVSCSGHGVCHTESRSCRCAEGYTAHNCAQAECPKNCSGHGVCTSGSCGCLEPFLGQDCSRVHYHTGCMYLTALCVALAVMLGSGVLCPGEHSQEVERFKQLYASTQPERLLGGAHHFGVYKPARFERAAYHVQNPAFSRVLERRAGPETGSVESPTRSSMQRRPAHLCVVPRNWDED